MPWGMKAEALARRALEVDLDAVGRASTAVAQARVIALPVSVADRTVSRCVSGLRFSLACSGRGTERCGPLKRQSSAASRPCSCFMLCRRWSAGTGFSNAERSRSLVGSSRDCTRVG